MGAKTKQPTRRERIVAAVEAIEALGWDCGSIGSGRCPHLWAMKCRHTVEIDWARTSDVLSAWEQLLEIVQAVDPVAFPKPKSEVKDA